MRLRLVEDVFNGHCTEFELEGNYNACDLKSLLKCPEAQVLQGGMLLDDEDVPVDGELVVIRVIPAQPFSIVWNALERTLSTSSMAIVAESSSESGDGGVKSKPLGS